MKNATKHADTLKALVKGLLKEHKPTPKAPVEPLPALVRGALSFDVSDHRADEAMKVVAREFVDLNELRVATELEIHEMLGTNYPDIERRVSMMNLALNTIFEKEHTLSLDRLKQVNRKEVRQFLHDLPDLHPFVEAYVSLYAFDAAAFPMDDATVTYLVGHEVLEEGVTLHDAQRFMENHVKAEDMYDTFVAVRRAVHEDHKPRRKK